MNHLLKLQMFFGYWRENYSVLCGLILSCLKWPQQRRNGREGISIHMDSGTIYFTVSTKIEQSVMGSA